jgi:alpha-ribazole phosphatase
MLSTPSTWVYLARHGEVLHAAEGRFFGHTDVALSPAGLAQAAALGACLAGESIEAVYASDLSRARQSAAPLATGRGTDVITVPPLREMAMGRWEGLTFAEIRAREPELCDRWLADPFAMPFPEGEGLAELRARAVPALREVVERHAGRRIAVVAHGGTNRVILAEALGLPLANIFRLAQDYAAWSLIEYRGGGAVVHALNQRPAGAAGAPPVESTLAGSRPSPRREGA